MGIDMGNITDPATMAAVLAYCKARPTPCWAIHTPVESTIGGFSCELLSIDGPKALTRIANGDLREVMVSELHLRTC
jgi:hypothetical protein